MSWLVLAGRTAPGSRWFSPPTVNVGTRPSPELVIGVCLLLGTVFGRMGVPDDKLAPILSTDGTHPQCSWACQSAGTCPAGPGVGWPSG